jgi:DNA-directed RNA polymerase subunit RPC12/RpoP
MEKLVRCPHCGEPIEEDIKKTISMEPESLCFHCWRCGAEVDMFRRVDGSYSLSKE